MRRKEAEEWAARKAADEVARQQEVANAELRRWKAEEQAARRATEEAEKQREAAEVQCRVGRLPCVVKRFFWSISSP